MPRTGAGRGNTLIIDPFAGISGDMFLGALVDLGLPAEWLDGLVRSLGLDARVVVERAMRSGIDCARVRFELPDEDRHRHLDDVLAVIEASGATDRARARAGATFRRLAEAEAAVHGVPVEKVHFHEVGALDSILDIVCGVAAVEELGYEAVYTRPVAVGSGTIEMAHGHYPLPAPATARLLDGLPVKETGFPVECTTPTGAALVAELTGGRTPPSEVVYGRSGYGAGTRDPVGRPNCLRLIECAVAASGNGTSMHLVQTDIDDLSPEYVAAARDALMEAGAADVTVVRVDMKKGRPGVRLEALAPAQALERVIDAFFAATTTIGVRHWPVARAVLERREETVEWRGHRIRVKAVRLPDGSTRRKPEFDDVAAAAVASGLTPRQVREEVDVEGRSDVPE